MWALGHIFIDRSNLEEAKKSLERARLRLQKHGDSICISPEGTRSKVGRLNDFKKVSAALVDIVGLQYLDACNTNLLYVSILNLIAGSLPHRFERRSPHSAHADGWLLRAVARW